MTCVSNRQCIALLHFSALPEVGGVEQLVQHQIDALKTAGHAVRILVGSGTRPEGVDFRRIKEMGCPNSEVSRSMEAREKMAGILVEKLRVALGGCHQCWVHNAFTLTLHPAMSDALHCLVDRMRDVRFVNWASDISAVSAHGGSDGAFLLLDRLAKQVRLKHVTISHVRRTDLARCTGIHERDITVIPPPVNPLQWMDIDRQTRRVVERVDLLCSELVVLVPAKLLPHKNLGLALEVAAELRDVVPSHRMLITESDSSHQTRESADVRRALLQRIAHRRLESNVYLLADLCQGPVPTSMVRSLMRLADLVFLPSREEGLGMPVLESALLRVPCLCADIPSFREAAGATTTFFHLAAAPGHIAQQLISMVHGPTHLDRRAVVRSLQQFTDDIADLAYACSTR